MSALLFGAVWVMARRTEATNSAHQSDMTLTCFVCAGVSGEDKI